jgi:hypothetical protein
MPEANVSAIDAARHKLEARLTIEASQTRARFLLTGAFVLPPGAEVRSRADRYGHLVLLPDDGTYRIAEPGMMRAVLGERRFDVAPLSPTAVGPSSEGPKRLGLRTRRVELTTRAATAQIDLATVRESGDGGGLVCRFLFDLMDARPPLSLCATDEVPLHAELHWTTQGTLAFEVTSVQRAPALALQNLSVPPASYRLASSPSWGSPGEPFLSKADFASLRTGPAEVPLSPSRDADAPPLESGLLLANRSDQLRVAWLDGVPAAWVAPGASLVVPTLVRGKYVLQWRTVLGDAWTPPDTIVVPGASATHEGP